jgi:hypothetical protein
MRNLSTHTLPKATEQIKIITVPVLIMLIPLSVKVILIKR